MKNQLVFIFLFQTLLFTFIQCTKFKSSLNKDNSILTNDSGSPTSQGKREAPLVTSDTCTELIEGRILNKPSQTTLLDNKPNPPTDIVKFNDMPFRSVEGWDPTLSNLDVWTSQTWKTSNSKKPVVLYIHGDGSDASDKSDLYLFAPQFPLFLLKKGFVFVSANYRVFLSDRSPGTRVKDQTIDIAKAVKWITNNITNYGGDPNQIVLVGMSHGAGIAALLGADQKYLQNEGINLDSIKGTISLDVPHYHIPLSIELLKGTYLESKILTVKEIYGATREEQLEMSPASYLENNSYVKPALLISAGFKDGQKQTVSWPASVFYKNELLRTNHKVVHYHFDERNHTSLANGISTDEVTQVINNFLDGLFVSDSNSENNSISLSLEEETAMRNQIFAKIETAYKSSDSIPGAVYSVILNKISMSVSCGASSLFSTTLNRPYSSTLFSIGSVTKIFTGLALAKLTAEGVLNLNTSINQLLPSSLGTNLFPSDVTLQKLVTHTSGLSLFPSNYLQPRDLNGDGIADTINPLNPAENYSESDLLKCTQIVTTDAFTRCQPIPDKINTYVYSNFGLGLLSLGLQDQGIAKYPSFSRFYRAFFGIPLGMDDSFAEASEINSLFSNLKSKNLSNSDVQMAISSLENRLAGLHNFGASSSSTPLQVPQPDMGMLAGAGEIKISPQALNEFLRLLIGLKESSFYHSEVLTEAHRPLFQDTEEKISYAIEIARGSDGSTFYKKTGATKGSSSFIAWSLERKQGITILMNREASGTVYKDAESLFESISTMGF